MRIHVYGLGGATLSALGPRMFSGMSQSMGHLEKRGIFEKDGD